MIQAFRKNSSTKMIHKNNWIHYVFRVFYGATSFRTWRYRLARTGCLLKTVSHCMRRVTKAWHHQHRWTVGSLQACSFIVICNKIRLLCSVSNSYCENRWPVSGMKTLIAGFAFHLRTLFEWKIMRGIRIQGLYQNYITKMIHSGREKVSH